MKNKPITPTVLWLYGLSGAGKTTIAQQLVSTLSSTIDRVQHLDGDVLRKGLNNNLGFSDTDRMENLRRSAEVAKLFREAGFVTICSFITPLEKHREQVRAIIGKPHLIEVFIKASLHTCRQRDPKGLYTQVEKGTISDFTGYGSAFEPPLCPDLIIDTEISPIDKCTQLVYSYLQQHHISKISVEAAAYI